ncbi:MAG TPA: hypothetical protein VFV26_01435, partial [Geothrix sp.]|nr:hypothetical protein [Geothrix sp.]
LDLNLGYGFKLAGAKQVRLMLDITNLFNSQSAVALDQRYNFSGLDVGQTNTYFKSPTAFQAPRSVRFGVRFSF